MKKFIGISSICLFSTLSFGVFAQDSDPLQEAYTNSAKKRDKQIELPEDNKKLNPSEQLLTKLKWKKFTLADEKIRLYLPNEPTVESDVMAIAKRNVPLSSFSTNDGDSSYFISQIKDLPFNVQDDDELRPIFFNFIWKEFVKTVEGAFEEKGVALKVNPGQQSNFKVEGIVGREQTFNFATLYGKARMIVVGKESFFWCGIVVKEDASKLDAFLQTFELTQPPDVVQIRKPETDIIQIRKPEPDIIQIKKDNE